MTFKQIDINCDLGEGHANDADLMPLIDSCNIACGGHFGDEKTIKSALQLAQKHHVKIGAHPSFPDRENFGRTIIQISDEALKKALTAQIQLFIQCATELNVDLHHIKLHGALYNLAAVNANIAQIMITVYNDLKLKCKLYVLPNSILGKIAIENNIPIWKEAFIDRTYDVEGKLVNRKINGALITDKTQAWQQLQSIKKKEQVCTINGLFIPLKADTFCIHGDTDHALDTLIYIRNKIRDEDT